MQLNEAVGRGIISLFNYNLKENKTPCSFKEELISPELYSQLGKFYLDTPLNSNYQIPDALKQGLTSAVVLHVPEDGLVVAPILINDLIISYFKDLFLFRRDDSEAELSKRYIYLVLHAPLHTFSVAAQVLSASVSTEQADSVPASNFFKRFEKNQRIITNALIDMINRSSFKALLNLCVLLNDTVLYLGKHGLDPDHEKIRYSKMYFEKISIAKVKVTKAPQVGAPASKETKEQLDQLTKAARNIGIPKDSNAPSPVIREAIIGLNEAIFYIVGNLMECWKTVMKGDSISFTQVKLDCNKEDAASIQQYFKQNGFEIIIVSLPKTARATLLVTGINEEKVAQISKIVNQLEKEVLEGEKEQAVVQFSSEQLKQLHEAVGRGVINLFDEWLKENNPDLHWNEEKIDIDVYAELGKFYLETSLDGIYSISSFIPDVLREKLVNTLEIVAKDVESSPKEFNGIANQLIDMDFQDLFMTKKINDPDDHSRRIHVCTFYPLHILSYAANFLTKSEGYFADFKKDENLASDARNSKECMLAFGRMRDHQKNIAVCLAKYGLDREHPRLDDILKPFLGSNQKDKVDTSGSDKKSAKSSKVPKGMRDKFHKEHQGKKDCEVQKITNTIDVAPAANNKKIM